MSGEKSGSPLRLAFFYMGYYLAQALYQSYISVYYTGIGLNAARIGAISAMVAITSMVIQPIWGTISDRASSRNKVLKLLCLGATLVVLTFFSTNSFLPLLLLGCLFAAFYTSIQPLGDSIILESLHRQGKPFGPIRLTGGLAFASISLLFGQLLDHFQSNDLIVYGISLTCLITFSASFLLPRSSGRVAGKKSLSFGRLLTNRTLVLLLLLMAPLMVTMGFFYTFFSPYFLSLPGGNSALLGWCYFISAICEIPFLLLSDRLFKKYGAGRLLCVAALALTLRWTILSLTQVLPWVVFSQVMHGWGFIVISVATAKYVDYAVPDQLKSSGQMLLSVISFGFARTVGNLAGGVLVDHMGYQQVFGCCAAVCAAALLAFLPVFFRRPSMAISQPPA